jgi:hypothetical protein
MHVNEQTFSLVDWGFVDLLLISDCALMIIINRQSPIVNKSPNLHSEIPNAD